MSIAATTETIADTATASTGTTADRVEGQRRAAKLSAARPVANLAGVAVDELRVGVEAHTAEAQRLDEREQRARGHPADAEVDRVALHVLAHARDLMALLAQH